MSFIHYVNGSFVSKATIDITDSGILRGYGIFDYVRLYQGKPLHLIEHLKHLQSSAQQMELSLPISIEDLYDLTFSLIEKNPPIDAGIRFLVTGGINGKDQFLPVGKSSLFMLFHPYTPHPERYYLEGMRVITTQMSRSFPSVKSTNYITGIIAMKKAQKIGFDDALYLDQEGKLLEGTTSNVFFFKDEKIITADSGIYKGVTREIILELAKEKFPIELRKLHLSEIEDCDEAFLTSSTKEIMPLVQIDDKMVGLGKPGPRTKLLRELFKDYCSSTCSMATSSSEFSTIGSSSTISSSVTSSSSTGGV